MKTNYFAKIFRAFLKHKHVSQEHQYNTITYPDNSLAVSPIHQLARCANKAPKRIRSGPIVPKNTLWLYLRIPRKWGTVVRDYKYLPRICAQFSNCFLPANKTNLSYSLHVFEHLISHNITWVIYSTSSSLPFFFGQQQQQVSENIATNRPSQTPRAL